MARYTFGGGRVGEVGNAADLKVGIARRRGAFTAFVLGEHNPALLRKGAPEALGGQLDLDVEIRTIRKHRADIPQQVNELGRYVLSVVAFGKRAHVRLTRTKLGGVVFPVGAFGETS